MIDTSRRNAIKTITLSGASLIFSPYSLLSATPQKNIRVASADRATGPFSEASAPITDTSYWAEGPTITRLQNKWVVYFDKYTKHAMGAVQSSNGKHWEDISSQVKFPNGTRHGTVFTISSKQWEKLEEHLNR